MTVIEAAERLRGSFPELTYLHRGSHVLRMTSGLGYLDEDPSPQYLNVDDLLADDWEVS